MDGPLVFIVAGVVAGISGLIRCALYPVGGPTVAQPTVAQPSVTIETGPEPAVSESATA